MVPFSFCFFFLVLLLLAGEISSQLGSGPHITDVNILLPPRMNNPVEYRLQGSDGCFKWYSTPKPIFLIVFNLELNLDIC